MLQLSTEVGVWAELGPKVLCCHTEISDVTKIIILLCGWQQRNNTSLITTKIPEQFHLLSETYPLCVMPTIISSETS